MSLRAQRSNLVAGDVATDGADVILDRLHPPLRFGIRGRLLVLVAAAVLPAFGLLFYDAWSDARAQIATTQQELHMDAERGAALMDAKIRAAKELLLVLAQVQAIRGLDAQACSGLLADLVARSESKSNALVIRPDGDAVCAARPFTGRVNYSDRDYFKRAAAADQPIVGAPVVGRVYGTPVVPIAHAIRDDSGQVIAVVVLPINMEQIARAYATQWERPGTNAVWWDREARIVFRWPDPENWIGKTLHGTPLSRAILTQSAGYFDAQGIDGIDRVYGLAPIRESGDVRLKLSISVPRDVLLSDQRTALRRNLALLALLTVIFFAAAWVLGELLVHRRLTRISDAAVRLGAGDLDTRISMSGAQDEFGALAASFNSMAEQLQARQRELERLNADLENRVADRAAQLAGSEARIRLLLQSAAEGIYGIDLHGTCTFCNDASLRLLGYGDQRELLGTNMHQMIHHTRADGSPYPVKECRIYTAYREGRAVHVEDEVLWRSDGTSFPAEYWSHPIYEKGAVVGAVVTFLDITERKRAEEKLREQNELIAQKNVELQQANEMKSQFLATMSHELRTPLNAIIGFSEVLGDGLAGPLTTEQREFVGNIAASGRHLLALINDILDLSKVEAGMMKLEPEQVRLDALIDNSLTIVKERALKGQVQLEAAIEPGLPAFSADLRKLKQIAYNLLSNAVKFTPEGGRVTLGARRVARAAVGLPAGPNARMGAPPASEAQAFVELSVRDTGIGIARADLERLFEPFVQVEGSLSRKHQGTGLGLALVKHLAELHGGTFGVVSEPGKGSTFYVWLPLQEAQPAQGAEGVPGAAVAPLAPVETAAALLVLVIEDDDAVSRLIEDQLKAQGFRTMRAATGEEGLVRAAKERPQLITLDMFLPHMDGWQVMERLKAEPELASIPVVIISIAQDLGHGVALGATRLLQKPFSRAELSAVLAGIVPRPGERARNGARVLVVDDNPAAVDLVESYLAGDYEVLRAYGGREAIEAGQRTRPDLILLDLMMPEVTGFDVVQSLKARAETAGIPIIVVTAKELTAEDRARLNGCVERIAAKAEFDGADFVREVRRALGQEAGDGKNPDR